MTAVGYSLSEAAQRRENEESTTNFASSRQIRGIDDSTARRRATLSRFSRATLKAMPSKPKYVLGRVSKEVELEALGRGGGAVQCQDVDSDRNFLARKTNIPNGFTGALHVLALLYQGHCHRRHISSRLRFLRSESWEMRHPAFTNLRRLQLGTAELSAISGLIRSALLGDVRRD